MKLRDIKHYRYRKWLLASAKPPWPKFTAEEQAWLDVAPVGQEFGSPDYDRLTQEALLKRNK